MNIPNKNSEIIKSHQFIVLLILLIFFPAIALANRGKIDSTNWNVFRSDICKYEVKYPPGASIQFDTSIKPGSECNAQINLPPSAMKHINISKINDSILSEINTHEAIENLMLVGAKHVQKISISSPNSETKEASHIYYLLPGGFCLQVDFDKGYTFLQEQQATQNDKDLFDEIAATFKPLVK